MDLLVTCFASCRLRDLNFVAGIRWDDLQHLIGGCDGLLGDLTILHNFCDLFILHIETDHFQRIKNPNKQKKIKNPNKQKKTGLTLHFVQTNFIFAMPRNKTS